MAGHFAFEEDAVAEKLKTGVWLRIISYAFRYWYLLIGLFLTIIITSLYDSALVPLMNKAAIKALQVNAANLGGNIMDLEIVVSFFFNITFTINFVEYGVILLLAMLVRSFSIFFTFFVTNYLDMKIVLALRRDSFKRVQELSFSYFDKTSSGWLIARMQNDTSKISDVLSWGIIRFVWIASDLIITLVTMFSISWELSLVILATSPLVMIISPYFEKLLLRLNRKARSAYSGFVGWLAECIAGSKTIKTLGIEKTTYEEAEVIIEDIRGKYYKAAKAQAFFQPSISVIAALASAIIIFVGYRFLPESIDGVLDVSILVLFIGFVSSIYNPIQEFAEIFGDVMATQANVEKVLSLIETKPQIVDSEEVIAKYGSIFAPKKDAYEPMHGEVEFKDINFSYIEGVEVIHTLNLKIKQGQSIAIVGETGSGKSTTVNLLCRFYEPTSGELLIDGIDYRKRSVGWLRSNIGFVQQNAFVFSGTIEDNIRYGKLDATREEVIAAAKVVNAHDFIITLPKGYDTVLEDGGNQLSVGQKQLISFARAIIRDPKIMILDEATSSIDTETEAVIQKAIKTVLKGRTSIIIAHRLSTIVDSDRILVMKDGEIVEDGSHRELMHLHGMYHKLYMNQFADLQVEAQIETYEQQLKDIA